jgi:hypothetical protein
MITYFSPFCIDIQIREPFSVMSFFKSPMGLMIGFMVLVMFVFPKMMEGLGM